MIRSEHRRERVEIKFSKHSEKWTGKAAVFKERGGLVVGK